MVFSAIRFPRKVNISLVVVLEGRVPQMKKYGSYSILPEQLQVRLE